MHKFKFGVALGGGGGRGLAHIGVLKGLEELGLRPDVIAGTSSGALIGSLYSMYGSADKVRDAVQKALQSPEIEQLRLRFFQELDQSNRKNNLMVRAFSTVRRVYALTRQAGRAGLIDSGVLESFLGMLYGDVRIEDLKIPFSAVAADLVSAEEVLIKEGSLARAIQASISRPGIFPALEMDGRQLVDGGVTSIVPVEAARKMGADYVLAVDVSSRSHRAFYAKNGLDAVNRAEHLMHMHLRDQVLKKADFVIYPSIKHIHWADFRHIDLCYRKGRDMLLGVGSDLLRNIKKARFRRAIFGLFK